MNTLYLESDIRIDAFTGIAQICLKSKSHSNPSLSGYLWPPLWVAPPPPPLVVVASYCLTREREDRTVKLNQ